MGPEKMENNGHRERSEEGGQLEKEQNFLSLGSGGSTFLSLRRSPVTNRLCILSRPPPAQRFKVKMEIYVHAKKCKYVPIYMHIRSHS